MYKKEACPLTSCIYTISLLDMPRLEKHFGRLVALGLLSLFIWRVALSGQMLLDKKVTSSVSKQYSKWRLFPSLSICVGLKNAIRAELLKNIDSHFKTLLDEVLVSLWHTTALESG